MTGADRQWAGQYEEGDVVRYTRGSKVLGIEAGEYAHIAQVDARENRVTIDRENGEHQTYDPRRLSGVAVYHETERAFSEGDRRWRDERSLRSRLVALLLRIFPLLLAAQSRHGTSQEPFRPELRFIASSG
jgi:hypothetical protein